MECGGLTPLCGWMELAPCGGGASCWEFLVLGVKKKCGYRRSKNRRAGSGGSGGKPQHSQSVILANRFYFFSLFEIGEWSGDNTERERDGMFSQVVDRKLKVDVGIIAVDPRG